MSKITKTMKNCLQLWVQKVTWAGTQCSEFSPQARLILCQYMNNFAALVLNCFYVLNILIRIAWTSLFHWSHDFMPCIIQRDEESKQKYEEMRREAKKEVANAKSKAYDELYEELDTKEGENTLYRLASQRHQAGKDVQQVRMMKDKDGNVIQTRRAY